ncbi:MAG TPA: SpoIID/LytB domain-containing protein [Bacteroidales bacterium]|nr:SpoIID/LytB domain-containing protein [Bacteroidales bacterium]
MIKIFSLVVLIHVSSLILSAADIKIGLYYGLGVQSFVFSAVDGEYDVLADGNKIARVHKGNIFHIEKESQKLSLSDTQGTYGSFTKILFEPVSASCIFQVKAVVPALPAKESDNELEASVAEQSIQLVNTLDIEKYIPGTVEAEGGSAALPEYYKAQAVLARTYAVKNFTRHATEGFNLCDGVHCQAYNGKSRMNREIYNATRLTSQYILTTKSDEPVVTAYHSNCGGMTANSRDVWNSDLPYLTSVKDPFCDKSSNRNWNKTIPLASWENFLKGRGYTGSIVSLAENRQKFLAVNGIQIPMTEIRQQFNLKSAYFGINITGGTVTFNGHGYGHGIGLCQQGAMEMARAGYSYVDILMFYFRGCKLMCQ